MSENKTNSLIKQAYQCHTSDKCDNIVLDDLLQTLSGQLHSLWQQQQRTVWQLSLSIQKLLFLRVLGHFLHLLDSERRRGRQEAGRDDIKQRSELNRPGLALDYRGPSLLPLKTEIKL